MRTEPVALAAALRCVLLAACAFGLGLTAEQIAAVCIALEAVLALFVRSRVTPVEVGLEVRKPLI